MYSYIYPTNTKYAAAKLTKSITVTVIIIKIVCFVIPFLAKGFLPIDLIETTVETIIIENATATQTKINNTFTTT